MDQRDERRSHVVVSAQVIIDCELQMNNSKFAKIVEHGFAFLIRDYGFKIEFLDGYNLKYYTDDIDILISQDPYEYYFDIRLRYKKYLQYGDWGLFDIVSVIENKDYTPDQPFQASSEEKIAECVSIISANIKKYDIIIFNPSFNLIESLRRKRGIIQNKRCKECIIKQYEEEALKAWKEGDFVRFIEVIESDHPKGLPIKMKSISMMSPLNKKRLEYAKKHLLEK